MERLKPVRLTKRDKDVIQGVIDGKRNKDIAAECGVSANTIKVYLSRVMGKVGVDGRLQLANWGRAYADAQQKVITRYREMYPDQPDQPPTFTGIGVAEFDVLKSLAMTTGLDRVQRSEIIALLLDEE